MLFNQDLSDIVKNACTLDIFSEEEIDKELEYVNSRCCNQMGKYSVKEGKKYLYVHTIVTDSCYLTFLYLCLKIKIHIIYITCFWHFLRRFPYFDPFTRDVSSFHPCHSNDFQSCLLSYSVVRHTSDALSVNNNGSR